MIPSKHLFRVWSGIALGIPGAGRPGEFGLVSGATAHDAARTWFQSPVRRLGPFRYALGQFMAIFEPLGALHPPAFGGRPRVTEDAAVAALLLPGMGYTQWRELAFERLGLSRSTFARCVRRLERDGDVERRYSKRIEWHPVIQP
jgi:hypothetical protein